MSIVSRITQTARDLVLGSADFRLYHLEYCGACFVVRRAAKELGIRLELVDTYSNPEARKHLIRLLGRSRVPVLGIASARGEQLLPESRDIVQYLREFAEKRELSQAPE